MFGKLLIANRGEIACRIARTARRLGIRTVAVHSSADAGTLHVQLADEAVAIGPAPARDSYLRADAVIAAARATGAGAIHPGYGFLAENADFATACAAAGLVFVGPSVEAIRAMGSKSAAKTLMAAAGIPVVPGYHGDDQSDARLAAEAAVIGYPVLLKAVAGGGGKGMRIVGAPGELPAALAAARREAGAAFGDDRMLVEKYLASPRHLEVQVFGDREGRLVHLFERDCSVQRRHQKVLEEAPAPGLSAGQREALCRLAVDAARAVSYVGAGTVEFIAGPDGQCFFMEMNTRLQVEHPVTEFITGLDLVEWQLRVAAGEPLPLTQEQITLSGHAIEVRLCAEDPARDFLPATGTLAELAFPAADSGVRVDAGVQAGDAIGIHYDPLLAKLIVHGPDRRTALRRLQAALAGTRVAGVRTNLAFLAALAAHPVFAAGGVDTGFIATHRAELLEPVPARAGSVADPWAARDGWRMNGPAEHRAEPAASGDDRRSTPAAGGPLTSPMPGRITAIHVGAGAHVRRGAVLLVLEAMKMEHSIVAPADGVVSRLNVSVGTQVEEGVELLVIESGDRSI
ncbi:MAG: ATP-grasp domain-containing protein [Gammaproteobacteria bacterium]|nr:ATP-grasp domain-containing protein [Gammaproteobacteria bacterium]